MPRVELGSSNDELKQLLKAEDADAGKLRDATAAAMQVFQRVGQAMYEQQQAQAAQSQTAAAPGDEAAGGDAGTDRSGSDDDVVEGEIVDEGGA